VLFSDASIAGYINRYFEPVWESVRTVPLVRIDFGNGTVVTRTLHGNIASYVCTADGQVLDILPGIYTPAVYQDRLYQFRLLANYVDQRGKENRETRVREFHQGQAEALKKNHSPPVFINSSDMSKLVIENRFKAVLVANPGSPPQPSSPSTQGKTAENPYFESSEELANWESLAEDTKINETVRRLQIHEMLANRGLVRPEGVTKWLYKDVLHADLDDPYLGLGPMLFANYPFNDKVH
jgi:hypothetical protein